MNKIIQIIRREYITRVRKRAFIIMTILGPILFAAFLILPYKLASLEDSGIKTIAVIELNTYDQPAETGEQVFRDRIETQENLSFVYLSNTDSSDISNLLEYADYYGILVIRQSILKQKDSQVEFYSTKQPSIGIESQIVQSLENFLYDQNIQRLNLSPEKISSLKSTVTLVTQKYENGKVTLQDQVGQKRGIAYAAGFLIYFFIFFFGAQVMRGVIEEKTSRIIEVIITSVRPFQLMMGKIGGIALVALTQFLAWIILTLGIYQYALGYVMNDPATPQVQQEMPADPAMQQDLNGGEAISAGPLNAGIFSSISGSEIFYFLFTFIFYFLGGYLLYGAMFAAIGAAVDSETDTQQFMFPVTIPLILAMIIMINAITNPEGELVYWFSMIPLTSPVVMMARIPFHPPLEQLLLSMGLLVVTFILFTWLAGKIYRTGILMYGKKASWREMIKWIRYRD
jgi:ABC-2 type transport system permease protein